jgi:hypothetical protein
MTGYFLKCTGQTTGSEGMSRWLTVACACDLCKTNRFVAVNEPNNYTEADGYSRAELDDAKAGKNGLLWRHIALGNLQIVGAAPKAADQPEECPPVKDPLGFYAGKVSS